MSTETTSERRRRILRNLLGTGVDPITTRQAEVIRDCARLLARENYRIAAAELRQVLAELEGRR